MSGMKIKVYVVTQEDEDGVRTVAVRLTYAAALAIMRLDGGRKVERFTATKSDLEDTHGSTGESSHGSQRSISRSSAGLRPQV